MQLDSKRKLIATWKTLKARLLDTSFRRWHGRLIIVVDIKRRW